MEPQGFLNPTYFAVVCNIDETAFQAPKLSLDSYLCWTKSRRTVQMNSVRNLPKYKLQPVLAVFWEKG